jgi:hypothetical protein
VGFSSGCCRHGNATFAVVVDHAIIVVPKYIPKEAEEKMAVNRGAPFFTDSSTNMPPRPSIKWLSRFLPVSSCCFTGSLLFNFFDSMLAAATFHTSRPCLLIRLKAAQASNICAAKKQSKCFVVI